MKQVLGEIQAGEFAREWILENQAGRPVFNALRRRNAEHPIEQVGAELRGDDVVAEAVPPTVPSGNGSPTKSKAMADGS